MQTKFSLIRTVYEKTTTKEQQQQQQNKQTNKNNNNNRKSTVGIFYNGVIYEYFYNGVFK